ncbi:amidohydrolase [Halieaceae bacterium IMCC14734]|uniref:Amidohydrolase n=1 Tax=Candidatus Litorirhabdus singularis TaxID=2518993 RepID=A0ABT3TKP9_9GAMM|nr:amidohydrolase [Candidatus Litorirhabdus singularis]MCX2982901.1 amidohydrolase [Candidatus Litorirhabdus singularis]
MCRLSAAIYSVALLCAITAQQAVADDLSDWVAQEIQAQEEPASELAMTLWNLAELGYVEHKSSAALQDTLRAAGFTIDAPVAGLPTAFVASYGRGGPVIGILAEFDALPGLSQQAEPIRIRADHGSAGHACGHHLFGAGSVSAAIAVARRLEATGQAGTIKLYGAPAEEGGSGKVYMVRAGLFDGVDAVLHWHPSDRNVSSAGTTLANKSAKFRFHGVAAHAAVAPHRGRSALDAVEAMNHMANMLREHVTTDTRIQYVITHGGEAPNVVPDFAEVYYYVRGASGELVESTFARLENAAKGAALGTGTTVEYEVIHGSHSVLPNLTLSKMMHDHLSYFGGVSYSPSDLEFANKLRQTMPASSLPDMALAHTVQPYSDQIVRIPGSTDVGDVSWGVPTVGLSTATWVPGTVPHTWQAVAAGGTPIGTNGMLLAAKAMARSTLELLNSPALLKSAQAEFEERRGPNFTYRPLLGDREPPLDYRAP